MDVVKILRICEMTFKEYLSGSDFRNPKITSEKNIKHRMRNRVIYELSTKKLFLSLSAHDCDHDLGTEDLHSSQLMVKIVNEYLDLRLLNYGKFYEEMNIKKGKIGMRQQSNKLVLFKGL